MTRTPQLLPRVSCVKPLDGFLLQLESKGGKSGLFDMNPHLGLPAFARLRDGNLFFTAKVERGTVVWDDMQDMSPDTLYLLCTSSQTPLAA